MEQNELFKKIENLEKRVSLLEKQLETISQINQSEKVKEYIASAEMKYARKYSIPVKRYEEFDLLEE